MADAVTERQPANRIITSPLNVEIPAIDVASYVFSSGTAASRGTPLYFNAEKPSQNFSLDEAKIEVKRFARGLQKLNLQPGDRVLLFSGNRLYFPIAFWAIMAAGCVFTAIAPSASALELEYQLRDSGARALLTSPEGAETALKAAKATSISIDRVFLFGDPDENLAHPQIRPWTDVFCSPEEVRSWSWKHITTLEEAKSTTAVINYSSGTTGLPKGVEVTHYNLVANSEQVIFKRNSVADTPLGRQRKANIDSSGERWLAPLPMYHAYGQTYSCMSAARIGAKVFILPNFTLQKYLQFLDIYRITFMTTVPTILTMLDKYENTHHFNLKAIEVVTSGSAPLNGEIAARITEKYMRAGVKVKQGWGLTETTCSVTGFPPDEDDDGRSIGWMNPNCAVKIVPTDDDGQATTKTSETVGEIWVAGPNMMKGYWRNEKATRETVVESDGYRWVRTGDIGYVDGRGCIYIVDRLKELIKVKGLQVAPAELQLILVTHPGVLDAAVVGAKINGQEHPRAFVVRKNEDIKAEDIAGWVKQRLSPHKWLTGGVYFVDSIPRTPSGKVKKRDLPEIESQRVSKL